MKKTQSVRALVLGAWLAMSAGMPTAVAQGIYGVEYGTGKIICIDDDAEESGSDYAASRAWDEAFLGAVSPCASQLTDLDVGVWLQTRPFGGVDSEGRAASFRIYILHDTYNWVAGSSFELEKDGELVPGWSIFSAPNFNERFCTANAAFGMGTSSSDGPTDKNNAIARERMDALASSLSSVRASCDQGRIPIVFGVNLGEHAERVPCKNGGDCTPPLADQRRVIIIATDELAIGTNLGEALEAGLREQDVFKGLGVDRYKLFDLVYY